MRVDRPAAASVKDRHYHVPAFMIVGVQKAGTTFLHGLLAQHPSLKSYGGGGPDRPFPETQAFRFPKNLSKLEWPKSAEMHSFCHQHTATRSANWCESGGNRSALHFTAFPQFVTDARLGERLLSAFPDMRTIIILRNPVDRYLSQLKMALQPLKGSSIHPLKVRMSEFLKLPECAEPDECARNRNLIAKHLVDIANTTLDSRYRFKSAVKRGMYVDQLRGWFRLFPFKTKTHVIFNDDLKEDPGKVAAGVLEFLGLGTGVVPPFKFAPSQVFARVHNDGDHMQSDPGKSLSIWFPPGIREELEAFYNRSNQGLSELLGGVEIPW